MAELLLAVSLMCQDRQSFNQQMVQIKCVDKFLTCYVAPPSKAMSPTELAAHCISKMIVK